MSLLSNLENRIIYMKSFLDFNHIIGSHNSQTELRQNLGYYMKQLKDSEHNDDKVYELLEKIYKEMKLDYDFEEFKEEYKIYLRLLADREDLIYKGKYWSYCDYIFENRLEQPENLDKYKWNYWGSYKQFIFGKYVTDALNEYYGYKLHPIWGALLSPTGGIVGTSNKELYSGSWNDPICMHGCVHDASGYLYLYHNIGNIGYNYLETRWTLFPRISPLSCQYTGIKFWIKLLK